MIFQDDVSAAAESGAKGFSDERRDTDFNYPGFDSPAPHKREA